MVADYPRVQNVLDTVEVLARLVSIRRFRLGDVPALFQLVHRCFCFGWN